MINEIVKLSFFSKCSKNTLEKLVKKAKINNYNKNSIMTYEEDDIGRVNFLLNGEVKLYKVDKFDSEIFLFTVSEDSLLTNIGSMSNDSISCFSNIEFLEDSTIISFDMHDFKEIVSESKWLLMNLIDSISYQKQQLEASLNISLVYDAMSKVSYMLYYKLETFNQLKKQEIAYRLNLQPATLSRVLAKLVKQDIIKHNASKVEIIDSDKLFELFN